MPDLARSNTREQVFKVAEYVAKSGAKFFRGGAFKPRTSPYAFQGKGEEGLKIMAEVRDQFGLNIVTEAMDERGIDLVEKYGDCIQIGARNMQNFSLLKYAGKTRKPILLKRGLSATLEEFLLAAEYIMSEGNYRCNSLRTRNSNFWNSCPKHDGSSSNSGGSSN